MTEALTPVQDAALMFATRLFKALVVFDDALEVAGSMRGPVLSISVRAHGADTPRLIGRGGQTFNAVRAVVVVAAARTGLRVSFPGVSDPIKGVGEMLPEFIPAPNWPKLEFERLLTDTCEAAFGITLLERFERNGTMDYIAHVKGSDGIRTQMEPYFQTLFRTIGQRYGVKVRIELDPP
jgi:predicted RNA-binding protein YlqC (UPF0109 family)